MPVVQALVLLGLVVRPASVVSLASLVRTLCPETRASCLWLLVYETVDFNLSPGNTVDPSPTDGAVLEALGRNGARFRGTCRIFAPLYRQMTLGTYYEDDAWEASPFFETAYEDIADAFEITVLVEQRT